MATPLKQQIEMLLAEAEQAMDPKGNGLLDRDDMRGIISRLVVTVKVLVAENESATGDRGPRLMMSPNEDAHDPAVNPRAT